MVGSFAEAFGPAAFFLRRPIRVVGCGGGSYLGFSFYRTIRYQHAWTSLRLHYNGPFWTCRLYRLRQVGLRPGQIVDCPGTRWVSKLQDGDSGELSLPWDGIRRYIWMYRRGHRLVSD